MNPSIDLHSMKRDLERTVDQVTHFAIENPILRARHTPAGGYFDGPLNDARYFHATSANRKGFEKHVAAMVKAEPELMTTYKAEFEPVVNRARQLYLEVEAGVTAEKHRLAEVRAKRAAKAQSKQDLGTDLSKHEHATVATFRALAAGLDPVRQSVERRYHELLTERHAALKKQVAKTGDYRTAFMVDDTFRPGRKVNEVPDDFWTFFDGNGTDRTNLSARLKSLAHERAVSEVLSFAGKLAGKVDRDAGGKLLTNVKVTGSDLWNSSLLAVTLENKSTQLWSTQIIWNRSCLGNEFNQWPTRRVS